MCVSICTSVEHIMGEKKFSPFLIGRRHAVYREQIYGLCVVLLPTATSGRRSLIRFSCHASTPPAPRQATCRLYCVSSWAFRPFPNEQNEKKKLIYTKKASIPLFSQPYSCLCWFAARLASLVLPEGPSPEWPPCTSLPSLELTPTQAAFPPKHS